MYVQIWTPNYDQYIKRVFDAWTAIGPSPPKVHWYVPGSSAVKTVAALCVGKRTVPLVCRALAFLPALIV